MCLMTDEGKHVAGLCPPNKDATGTRVRYRENTVLVGSHCRLVVAMGWPCRTPRCGSVGDPDKDAWWRKAVKAILTGPSDATHHRLNRKRRGLGKR